MGNARLSQDDAAVYDPHSEPGPRKPLPLSLSPLLLSPYAIPFFCRDSQLFTYYAKGALVLCTMLYGKNKYIFYKFYKHLALLSQHIKMLN